MNNDPSGDIQLAYLVGGFWLVVVIALISASYYIYTLVA